MSDIPVLIPKDRRELVAARIARHIVEAYPGSELECIVRKRKRERSDPQNHALFGVAYPPVMEFCGLSGAAEKDELHETFCGDYFGWVVYDVRGHKKRKPRRTTTKDENGKRDVLSTVDFMEFYAFVQRKSAELGVFVPDPDPEWFSKRKAA